MFSAFSARGTFKGSYRHILLLEANNVPANLVSGHLFVMQDLVLGLRVSVLEEDGKMSLTLLFLMWKLRLRQDVRAVKIRR